MTDLDFLEAVLRQPNRAHEPLAHKLRHRTPRLVKRNAGIVGPVQEVGVEVFAPETFQTVTAGLLDLFTSKAASSSGHRSSGRNLRSDQEAVIDPFESRADQRLVTRREVVLGRVQPVHTALDRPLDDAHCAIDIRLLVRLRPQLVAAETDARERKTARPDGAELHGRRAYKRVGDEPSDAPSAGPVFGNVTRTGR